MKRGISAIIASLLILTIAFVGNNTLKVSARAKAPELTGTVSCSGSTALLPIVKQAADDFMKANGKVNVTVAGGGSGTGLQQVADGIVNIGNSDVYATDKKGLVDHQVALEPFAFIVNSNVKVSNLTKDQVIGIFSGKITNWKEVGGSDMKIAVVMRQASSGTRMTIKSLIMGSTDFTNNAIVQESSGAVKSTVANTPGSIGYVDFAYIDSSIKALSYNGIAPTIDNVKNGKYVITAIGHMYTKGEATGAVKAFLDYVQSSAFQNRVLPFYKFVPVSNSSAAKASKIKIASKKNTIKRPVTKKK